VTADRLGREVRNLAVPAILSSLLVTLVLVVDRAMLGHHGEASLAAMQIAGPVEWSAWGIFSAFQVGTMARVGRHVGAGDLESARRAAKVSLALAVFAGVLVALATPALLALIRWATPGASDAVMDAACSYLRVTLLASPVVLASATAIAALQASGDTRTPLVIGIGVNLIHVASNRVLILGFGPIPALGAYGCGISTALAFTLEASLALSVLAWGKGRVTLLSGRDPFAVWKTEGRRILAIASPSLLERVLYHGGYLGFVAIIARLGEAPMAANQALLSIESICYLSADGFGIAAAALVAQKLGAGRPDEAVRAAKVSARYAVCLLTSLGGLAFLFRWPALRLFSREQDVVALGVGAVSILLVAQPFLALGTVLAQALRGAGDTRTALAVSAVGALFVRLACTWLFAVTLGLGLRGVWIGSTCDWVTRTVLLLALGRKRARTLVASPLHGPP
jgi:MATE family multidrug resistance protein